MKKLCKEFELKFDERGNLTTLELPVHLQGKESAISTFGKPNKKSVCKSLNRLNDAFIYQVDETNAPLKFKIKTTYRHGGRLD